jgi:predicted nucleic acid-binding protein
VTAPVPYDSPEQHLGDQIAVVRWLLAAALRRREVLAAGDDLANDAEHARAIEAARAADAASADRAELSAHDNLPLERLRLTFNLSVNEVHVLVLLTALELDTELRERARRLVGDRDRPHPDVGLLIDLFYIGRDRARVPEELGPGGRLIRFALIRSDRLRDAPFALRRVRAVERVVDLLHGRDVLDRDVARFAELVPARWRDELVVDASRYEPIANLVAAAFAASKDGVAHPAILVSGPEGAGRSSLLAAAAGEAGLTTLRVRCKALPRDEAILRELGPALVREIVLHRALVVLDALDQLAIDNPAFQIDETLLAGFIGPMAAVIGRVVGRPPQLARGSVIVELGVPPEADRVELWRRALDGAGPDEVAHWAARRYSVTPGVVLQAAAAARASAAARARGGAGAGVTTEDVHAGLRSTLDAKLATLGTRVPWRQRWSDLVLPEDSIAELREFIARVKHRHQVYETWGFGAKVAKGLGLSALFAGPPGTGKTMVAGLIAGDLGLDLYQIDLSRVVSKWVGETEKNLADLFEAAEAGHAVLLFDEADSLFAKRTEVKTSNDRYANLEINYLLQRMESFAGITILTTNNDTAIDDAFRRRLSLKIDFPIPEPEERERLWRALLPGQAGVAADIDFTALAERFEMTGGFIKNAALRAAFLAADEHVPIAMRHMLRAARSEYQAMGKLIAH